MKFIKSGRIHREDGKYEKPIVAILAVVLVIALLLAVPAIRVARVAKTETKPKTVSR